MLVRINPDTPQERLIQQVVTCLKNGGIIIYPTDTVYGLGCDMYNKKAVARICRLKGIDPNKAYLSCVCDSIKSASEFTAHISTPIYKMIRQVLPGPYTFILRASKGVPKHFQTRKKTVGIRVVNHPIPLQLLQGLGHPIVSISLDIDEEIEEYNLDPELIHERYERQVDMVVDGGYGSLIPSTVVDCSRGEDEVEVIREGAGSLEALGLATPIS